MLERTKDLRVPITALGTRQNQDTDSDLFPEDEVLRQDYDGQYGFRRRPVLDNDDLDSIDPRQFDRTFKRKKLTRIFKN